MNHLESTTTSIHFHAPSLQGSCESNRLWPSLSQQAFPASLDLTHKPGQRCLYEWPHCALPLYAGAQPTVLNISLLCGCAAAILWSPR